MEKNRYFFYRNDQHYQYFEFFPDDSTCLDDVGYKYFGRVLHELAPVIENKGLIIFVTSSTVSDLPIYGPNVISCVLEEELGLDVAYRDNVGMIFRTCGQSPFVKEAFDFRGVKDVFSNALEQALAFYKGSSSHIKNLIKSKEYKSKTQVYDIPIGYYANEEVDFVPFSDRQNDLFFAGSVQHVAGGSMVIKNTKELARDRMQLAMRRIKHREIATVKTVYTSSFSTSLGNKNLLYLQNMMNAKICPVPRGKNLDTFRFYEALRYGCIPVGETFPKSWFYDGAPFIKLESWADLPKKVSDLLANPDRMEELHQKALSWWNDKCSEKALSEFMNEKIMERYKSSL